MSKKKQPKFKPFESAGGSDTFALITESMLMSEAWKDLNPKEHDIYTCMKAQLYKGRKPKNDFPTLNLEDDCFYFNWNKAIQYGLYEKGKSTFYKSVHNIEAHGFIETVSNGKSNKSKSIYRFTGKWKEWGKEQ